MSAKYECTTWVRTKFGRKHGWAKFCYRDGVRIAGAYLRPCRAGDVGDEPLRPRCLKAELVEFYDRGKRKDLRYTIASEDVKEVYRHADGFLRQWAKE